MSETGYKISQQMESRSEREERDFWSYFDAYKTVGAGKAVGRPDMAEFHHVSDDSRQRDLELLAKQKQRDRLTVQRETGPDAFAFENFLITHAKQQRWFGGELYPTTEYDDWVSGADAVVEWKIPGKDPVHLAVDFTVAEEFDAFYKKSGKLERGITIKYFHSDHDERLTIPVVILGFDKSVFELIAKQDVPMTPEHPLRRMLMEQVQAQVDLQILLITKKAFSSRHVRTAKSLQAARTLYESFGDGLTADQAVQSVERLNAAELDLLMNSKTQDLLLNLHKVKAVVDEQVLRVKDISMDADWQKKRENSVTHAILSAHT